IEIAEDFLHKFVKDFEALYGLRHCSINSHQIIHLPDCVRRLGPLWSSHCYEYENMNGLFLKLIKGTSHIDTQVANSH
ncbi:GSCOCG00011959001-RA-CDS, partial [Cotesia congregata]